MTGRIIGDLRNEREKQDKRYGEYTKHTSPLSSDNIAVILTQLGEASSSLNYLTILRNSGTSDKETELSLIAEYRKKLVAVSACAIRTLEQLDSLNDLTETS